VVEEDGSYHANPNELILLEYYANAIAHLFMSAPAETPAEPKRVAPLRAQG